MHSSVMKAAATAVALADAVDAAAAAGSGARRDFQQKMEERIGDRIRLALQSLGALALEREKW